MSLREEMKRYEKLTGESAEHIPIIKLGSYLDGVDKGIEKIEKIKAEIEKIILFEESCNESATLAYECLGIVDKELYELKESEEEE